MFKVNAAYLNSALDCAAVGNGKGFVMMVSPKMHKISETQEAQMASISSSDGDKTGRANLIIQTNDMEKDELYFASASLKPAVASLAKITDTIFIDSKGTYLEVSDEKKESVVRVPLLEKDTVLELPNSPDGAVLVMIEREKFVNAIRLGGYSAEDSNIAGIDVIGFHVDVEAKKLMVVSRRSTTMCQAITPISDAAYKNKGSDEKPAEWHLINHKFIQNLLAKLTGDILQIAFTEKFMVVRTQNAIFGSKKSEGTMAQSVIDRLSDKSFDYTGTVSKKELLLGMEISIVGVDEKIITLETSENGTLRVSSMGGSNKSNVTQKAFEGKMEAKSFYVDVLKSGLSGCADTLHYYGKQNPKYIVFDGENAGVSYVSIIAPVEAQKAK